MSTTDYLDPLNWAQSTGGDPGSAETTTTVGTDRLDTREPPDQYHFSGLQISRMRALLVAMSQSFKGCTRLQVLEQSANPLGAGEHGFWVDTDGEPRFTYNGVAYFLCKSNSAC